MTQSTNYLAAHQQFGASGQPVRRRAFFPRTPVVPMRFPIRSFATLVMMVGVATCSDTPIAAVKTGTSPSTRFGIGQIALAPVFSKSAQYAAAHVADFPTVRFDSVRVVIRGVPDTTQIVKDTTVFFDVNSAELSLELDVPVQNDGQKFQAAMDYRGPAGVVYHGVQVVQSHRPDQPAPVQQPIFIDYVGVGSFVKSITVAPLTLSLSGNQCGALTVTAVDANNSPISVPLAYTTSDAGIATVSNTGLVQAQNRRGTATITVRTPTQAFDNAAVSVTLPPSAINTASGSGQSGRVGATLANPAVVQVVASDGIGVAGVNVIFAAPTGGSVSPTTATTDANGRASTTMKLGTTAGPQGFTATAVGLSTAINVTATPGDPSAMAIVAGNNQTDSVRAVLAPLSVRVSDSFNNPVSGATVSWTKSGGGALANSTTTTNGDGVATNGYSLGAAVGTETVTASVGSVTSTFTFTTTGGRPASIVAVSGNGQSGKISQPLPNPVVVKVADASGNPVRDAAITWTAQNATITSTTPSDAAGQASAAVTLGRASGSATVTAAIASGPTVTFTATAQPGAPAAIVFAAQPANGIAAQPLAAVRVSLRDAGNNATEGTVTIALAGNPGGATLGGSLSQPTSDGVATFSNLTINRAANGYTLRASSNGLTATSTAFNVTAGSGSGLTIVAGNQQSATVNTAVATPPSVKLVDAANNPVAGASVTFAPAMESGSVVPATRVVTTNEQGIATLTSWTLGKKAGTQTLVASTESGQLATFTADAKAGNANKLVLKTSLQSSVTPGALLSPQPTIQVTDEFGNAVPAGQMQVSVLPTSTTVIPGGTTSLSLDPASGSATFTDLKLNGTGTTRLVFTEGSGRIKPDTSNTISLSGGSVAVSLRLVPATQTAFTFTAGQPVTLPQVQVVDAQGNGVASVTVRAEVDSGTGPGARVIGTNSFVSDGSGFVSLTQPPATTAGVYQLLATSDGIHDTLKVTATVNPGPAYKVSFANRSALQTTVKSDSAFSPQPKIQIVDQYKNAVAMSGVNVVLSAVTLSGSSAIRGTAAHLLDASGGGTYSDISVSGSGTMRLVVTVASGATLAPDSSDAITVTASSGSAAASIERSGAASFSGVVGTSLTTLPAVLVKNSAGSPVAGTMIVFTIATGTSTGNRTADTVTTNSNGIATLSAWKLPTSVGTDTVTARPATGSLTGSPVTFTASAVAGSIVSLEFESGHGLPTAGFVNDASYSNHLQLVARDTYRNRIPGLIIDATTESSGSSTSSMRRPGPAENLLLFSQPQKFVTDTTATTDASGVADFGNVKFRGQTGSLRLLFIERSTGRPFRFTSSLLHGAAAKAICMASLPGTVRTGHRMSVLPKLEIRDVDSNLVDNATVTLSATAGSVTSTNTTDSTGQVSALSWNVRGRPGEDSVKVNGANGGCHVRAADAKRIKLSVTSLARQKNGRLIPSIDASVVDSTDTELEDEAFSVVAEARPQQGKAININRTKLSNNHGRATFDSLTVDAEEQTGAYLKFSSTVDTLTLRDSLSFDVEMGDPEALGAVGATTAHGAVGTLVGGTFKVQVKDHGNRNNVNSATNTVTWTTTGCTDITFRLPTSDAVNGIASSPEIVIAAGFTSIAYPSGCTITASAPSLSGGVTFTVTP